MRTRVRFSGEEKAFIIERYDDKTSAWEEIEVQICESTAHEKARLYSLSNDTIMAAYIDGKLIDPATF